MMIGQPTFDLYATVDLLVEDADSAAARLVDVLGLPEPEERWAHRFPGYGYEAVFCRVQPALPLAPTVIEVIAPARVEQRPGSHVPRTDELLRAYADQQGSRRPKTHATVLAVSDPEELAADLRSRGVTHRVEAPTAELPFPRLWVGSEEADPTAYDPSSDGGLFVEVVPLSATGADRGAPDAGGSEPPRPGTLDRVLARGFVVDDLAATLDVWREHFGWEPERVDDAGSEGCRRAVFSSRLPRGARLELLEPVDPQSRVGRHRDEHGAGPHHIRLGVHGLAEKARELADRDIPHGWVPGPDEAVGPRIEVAPEVLDGAIVELAETF